MPVRSNTRTASAGDYGQRQQKRTPDAADLGAKWINWARNGLQVGRTRWQYIFTRVRAGKVGREDGKMVDEAKLNQFIGQILGDLGGALSVSLGAHR